MRGIGWRMPRLSGRWLPLWRLWYALRRLWRDWRVSRGVTRLFGPQYVPDEEMIEIDITYLCNLSCMNCNRSVVHAPGADHMPLAMIQRFVETSLQRPLPWRRIRILGGEPTLHPAFQDIVTELTRLRDMNPELIIEVVSNGYGSRVKRALAHIPGEIWVENSEKSGDLQPHFRPFSDAPIDDPRFKEADFANGCAIVRDCGIGLTPGGFYPCAVAGGIDRVLGLALGQPDLPMKEADMRAALSALCRYCGRFKDGHFIPQALRQPLMHDVVSPTWALLYARFRERRALSVEPAVPLEAAGKGRAT